MIRHVAVEAVRITPAGAELIIRVELDETATGTEVRGVLIGPRCTGISTVEVAYPLRPVPERDGIASTLRVLIPEPNLWSPTAPFRYDGRVEVWRDGTRRADRPFAVELRAPRS